MLKKRLKQCREEKGVSQTNLAEYLMITRQAYNHYETGNRLPTQETLIKIAEYFNVSTDYLLGRTDEPRTKTPDEEIRIAAFGEARDFTDEETEEIKRFIDFVKSKRGELPKD